MRNIVRIDEEKCNGCGQCVIACAEGAIEIIDGKAKLVSEIYCDGLGACLGTCPEGAITIEQREAADFDKEATKAHLAEQGHAAQPSVPVCPGLVPREIKPGSAAVQSDGSCGGSQLSHWPILLNLVSPTMPCFADADLLLVADCVPFAMGDFHNKILKDHSVAVGCPKFGNVESYIEKVAAILKSNKLKSLSVVHMEVPCCSGLTHIAREAIGRSGVTISFDDITIGINGEICKRETIES